MKIRIILILLIFLFVNSCDNSSQKFNSEKWKSSGKSLRGSMAKDLIESEILKNKTKDEVERLLGKANESENNYLGYEVITISRCYFWKCQMEISFDSQTHKITGEIEVSD